MAATRNEMFSVDHLNYFATISRYPLLNRERITRRFYEIFPLPESERAQAEKNLYQDIQTAALYLMLTAVHQLGVDLKLIWPQHPLPEEIVYRHDRDSLMTNLEEHIIFKGLYQDIRAYAYVDSLRSLTQYAYLYKEMYSIFRYSEVLLRYLGGQAKLSDLQKCVEDNVATLRITDETAKRIHRANQTQNKKLKLQKKTHTTATEYELPPNVFNEWFNQEHFALDDNCDVEDMTPQQRTDMKFALLFLQKLLDEVSSNAFSHHKPKLAEIINKGDIVVGYLKTDYNTVFTIGFTSDTPAKRDQEAKLKQFLKLDVIAAALGKIIGMSTRAEAFRQLFSIFQNTNELFSFFDQDLDKYVKVTDDGAILLAHVPEGVINNQREVDEIFRTFGGNRDEYLDDKIFSLMWALNKPALLMAATAAKKIKPVKPRAPNKSVTKTARADMTEEKTAAQKSASNETKSQEEEKVPTPLEKMSFSVKDKHKNLQTYTAAVRLEAKSLQQEYRKLYRYHSAAFSKDKLADWAQKIEYFDDVLEKTNDKLAAFQLPEVIYDLQDAFIDFSREQHKITAVSTQIKTLKRELGKEVAAFKKTDTVLIQQRLAEKKSAKKAKQERTASLTPSMSPARSQTTRANSEEKVVDMQSPEQRAQVRRSSMTAFSLFDNRGNNTPTSATSNSLSSPRQGG